MIKLSFVTGGALRKVEIENKTLKMMSQETGFVPIIFNLEKLEESKQFKKLDDKQKILLKEIKLLKTEEAMAEDIKKDFQRSGWRLVKRE